MLATSTEVLFVPIEILPRVTLLVMKIKPFWHCQMLFFYAWNFFKSPDFGIRECWTLMPCWWLASYSRSLASQKTLWSVVQGCLCDILRPWEILQNREESRGRRPRIAEPEVNLGGKRILTPHFLFFPLTNWYSEFTQLPLSLSAQSLSAHFSTQRALLEIMSNLHITEYNQYF